MGVLKELPIAITPKPGEIQINRPSSSNMRESRDSRKPIRELNTQSDVWVPFLIAFIIGCAAGGFITLFQARRGYIDWYVTGMFTIIVMLFAFIWRVKWGERTVHAIENMTQRDINNDGVVGAKPDWYVSNAKEAKKLVLTWDQLRDDMIRAIYANNGATTMNTILTMCQNKGLDRPTYETIRDRLLAAGLARKKGNSWVMLPDTVERALEMAARHVKSKEVTVAGKGK